jgi:dynein heavy chain 2
VPRFLPILEKEFVLLNKHDDFRLWLTTEESDSFPAILLETCFKVSYETPPGIRQNIERAYTLIDNSYLEKSKDGSNIMFVLAFFHAIISERRSYIPQGWSKFYEFSFADFIAALKISETLDHDSQHSIETYIGLLESAIYGGRIDNISDMHVLKSYLRLYFEKSKLSGGMEISESIKTPQAASIQDHLQAISPLPANDNPKLFGLSTSADIAVQKYNVQEIINSLKKIKQVDASNVKFDREQWKTDLSPIIKQWKSCYQKLAETKIPIVKEEELLVDDPLNGFVLSEIRNGLNAIRHMGETFKKIIGILKGELAIDEDTQKTCISLILGKTPMDWLNIWEGPDSPIEWMRIFFKKLIS